MCGKWGCLVTLHLTTGAQAQAQVHQGPWWGVSCTPGSRYGTAYQPWLLDTESQREAYITVASAVA
jgi:hypothetical protein